jgi:hypothetical protein
MQNDGLVGEFRPELLSRRGEIVAWGLALVVTATWVILRLYGQAVPVFVVLLDLFFLLAALSISLGNWMDRRTVIHLDSEGMRFENGLRHVALTWQQIKQVQVYPTDWGKKVSVVGARAHFEFRTLAEVKVQDQVKGRLGFVEGDQILQGIIQAAGLVEKQGEPTQSGVNYYARE